MDPVLVRIAVGSALVAAAFLVRVGIHVGRQAGGVDTWYYLAYADVLRRRFSLDVRLPQYLLQDQRQSYAPGFPTLLAAIPRGFLLRWFWTVSPAIDCLHLALLYALALRITGSLAVAALAAAAFALTPQLVSETRSLNGRSLGALLCSVSLLLAIRFALHGEAWPWLPLAVAAGATLLLGSAALSAAYSVVSVALAVTFADPRYLLPAALAVPAATLLSFGHFLRVVRNYLHALAYWRRNRAFYGAHPVRHSPVYGDPKAPRGRELGFLGGNVGSQLLRLLGENPFLLVLPLAPYGAAPWGPRLYTWAMALAALALVATVLPPLRAFGPGRSYMRAGAFPTAYTLAVGIGGVHGLTRPVGLATLLGLVASAAAIAFFYRHVATRRTDHTATTPLGLAAVARRLAELPHGGVFCLPYMYADYVAYHSGQPVLWGGHCGDLRRLEALAPVITRPLPELFQEHSVRWVLLQGDEARTADLDLGDALVSVGQWEDFRLYEYVAAEAREVGRDQSLASGMRMARATDSIRSS